MDEKKLTAREKIVIWCVLYVIRLMTPNDRMTDDMKKMVESIQHQVYCNL